MTTKSLLSRKMQLAFASAILTLLVVGAISYLGMVLSSESDRSVRHTHEVIENLQDLLISMQRVESGYRRFALTGSEIYSESFHADMLRWQQDLTTLRSLTEDNPAQQRQFTAIDRLANQKFEFGEKVISLRRTKGLEAAADSIRSGPGQRIMEGFQVVVRGLQDEELRLLVLRNADAQRRLGQTKIVLILGTVLFLLIAAAAGWSVQRDSSGRGLTEEALRDSEERYRMLLDGVQDYAIFMLDPQGQVVSWNAGAERIKRYTAEQIIGHNFSCFFPPEDIERGRPQEVLRMTAASGRHEEEGMRVRKDGSRFLARVTLTTLRDANGNLRGFS
jgi:PAS domain S-box-containing protein